MLSLFFDLLFLINCNTEIQIRLQDKARYSKSAFLHQVQRILLDNENTLDPTREESTFVGFLKFFRVEDQGRVDDLLPNVTYHKQKNSGKCLN